MPQLFMNTLLESDRVRLRPMKEEDAGLIVKWRNDPEIRKWLFSTTPMTVPSHLKWFHKPKADRLDFIICLKDPEIPIGTVNYINIDFQNFKAEAGKMLGDRSQWGKGLAKEAFLLWLKFGFKQLSLRCIYVQTKVENINNIKLNERMGFKIKKSLKTMDERVVDMSQVLVMELTKKDALQNGII